MNLDFVSVNGRYIRSSTLFWHVVGFTALFLFKLSSACFLVNTANEIEGFSISLSPVRYEDKLVIITWFCVKKIYVGVTNELFIMSVEPQRSKKAMKNENVTVSLTRFGLL